MILGASCRLNPLAEHVVGIGCEDGDFIPTLRQLNAEVVVPGAAGHVGCGSEVIDYPDPRRTCMMWHISTNRG
jgi:hypothetical protein